MKRDPDDIFSSRGGLIGSAQSRRFRQHLLDHARIEDDRRRDDRGSEGRRRFERAEIAADATLRAAKKLAIEARVRNLSAGGCCLLLRHGAFSVGETVWFKVDGVESWIGTVRWAENNRVGVEFDRPFHPSVFGHIAATRTVSCARLPGNDEADQTVSKT